MKRSIKIFLITTLLSLGLSDMTYASHLLGGEITWECVKTGSNAGKFIFHMKIYRDCGLNTATLSTTQTIKVFNGPITSFTMTQDSAEDISPGVGSTCANPIVCNSVASGQGAIEEHVYSSSPMFLNGVPPAAGWVFTWASCCRPITLTNLPAVGYTLRAIMYAYNSQNENPCFDNSPFFIERPKTVLTVGYPFRYNHNAEDMELDSLHYAWAHPLDQVGMGSWNPPTNPNYVIFNAPYSYNHAIPDTSWINPNTGEITIVDTTTQGSFATCVQVDAYKCGQKVASIFRDIPVIFGANASCAITNHPPNLMVNGQPVTVGIGSPSIIDTVTAGTFISFPVTSTDFEQNCNNTGQMNYLIPSGAEIGTGLVSDTGCLKEPCAYFSSGSVVNGQISAMYGVATTFSWQTTCAHIAFNNGCVSHNNVYNFLFKVKDNFCPIPGLNFLTYTVVVLAPPPVPAPKVHCVDVLPNGDVQITYDDPTLTDTLTNTEDSISFYDYEIDQSNTPGGPYSVLDTIADHTITTYTHVGANANNHANYYYLTTRSACHGQYYAPPIDSVASMFLTVTTSGGGTMAHLNWNPLSTPLIATSTGWYYVHEKLPAGTWQLVDSVATPEDSLPISVCNDSVFFYISVTDSSGCISRSNIAGNLFGTSPVPQAVIIDSVSVSGNNVAMAWNPSPTPNVVKYMIYQYIAPSTYILLDSTSGYTNTTYTYTGGSPTTQSLSFVIVPIDTCGNIGDTSLVHNTIYLHKTGVDSCLGILSLAWNSYINWASGVQNYVIRRNDNGGPFTTIGTVSGGTTTFNDNNLVGGHQYCYIVEAVSNTPNQTSSSNEFCFNAAAISPLVVSPDLRCISVLANGNIELTWIAPNDPDNTFNSYHIFRSPNINGPYTEIDSIFAIATTTYTDAGVNGQSQSYYYYVYSRSGCAGFTLAPNSSDTLESILLTDNVINGVVGHLTWNKISVPKIPTNGDYNLNKAMPLGSPYNLLATLTYGNESFLDTNQVCDSSASYYVEVADQSGCISRSSVDSIHYLDTVPPPKQFMDSVSVNNGTGHAYMGWTPNSDMSTYGYYIVIPLGTNSYQIIDTLYGRLNDFYEYLLSNAENQSETYGVIAFDSCGNYVNNSFNFNTTMYLKTAVNKCDKSITLTWNKYRKFNSGATTQYAIYENIGGAGYNMIGTTNDSTYTVTGLASNTTYAYFIVAIDNGGSGPFTSTSSIDSVKTEFPVNPKFAYMYYATVQDSTKIVLSCYVDTAADVSGYKIKRSLGQFGNFKTIKVMYSIPGANFIDYTDNNVDTKDTSYVYKVYVVNQCGQEILSSNIGKTILLKGTADNLKLTATLDWTPYKDWYANVKQYKLYRGIDGNIDPTPIATLPATQMHYVDDLSDEIKSIGKICYLIEADENNPSYDSLDAATSLSNIECVYFSPIVYIPNAFNPFGLHNPIFKPVLSFTNPNNYSMNIFNRWGQLIFHTGNKDQGWDGTYSGNVVETGVYVYSIKFYSAQGKLYEKRGTVTVIR